MNSKITLKGLALAAIILVSFAPWIYRWSGQADRPFPDTLDVPAFGIAADPICAAAMEELPDALRAQDNIDRARQLREGTARLQVMVDDLSNEVTGTERDVRITNLWLEDWEILLGDRLAYADRLEEDEFAFFYVTQLEGKERLEKRISRFALTNKILSCVSPGDVG